MKAIVATIVLLIILRFVELIGPALIAELYGWVLRAQRTVAQDGQALAA
jgi:hypothetical protein